MNNYKILDNLTWNKACVAILSENIKIDDDLKNELVKRFDNPSDLYYICVALDTGRCEPFEKIIEKSMEYSCLYALEVVQGRLPEQMHNKMLAHYIKNPEIYAVKMYFKLYG